MRFLFALSLAWVISGTALADLPDDTIRHYLAKSRYAVVGEVISAPVKVERVPDDAGGIIQKGQVVYTCRSRW